jgi:hypothetical protein
MLVLLLYVVYGQARDIKHVPRDLAGLVHRTVRGTSRCFVKDISREGPPPTELGPMRAEVVDIFSSTKGHEKAFARFKVLLFGNCNGEKFWPVQTSQPAA